MVKFDHFDQFRAAPLERPYKKAQTGPLKGPFWNPFLRPFCMAAPKERP